MSTLAAPWEIDLDEEWDALRVRYEEPPKRPVQGRSLHEYLAQKILGQEVLVGLLTELGLEVDAPGYRRQRFILTARENFVFEWDRRKDLLENTPWPAVSGIAFFNAETGECMFTKHFPTIDVTSLDRLNVSYRFDGVFGR